MPDSPAGDDLAARVTALEQENAELRAALAAREAGGLEVATLGAARRTRLAKLMLAGGAVALLGGVFAWSWFAVLCGLGWMFGGAAVASSVRAPEADS